MTIFGQNNVTALWSPNQTLVMNDRHLIIKNPCIDCDCEVYGELIIHLCNVIIILR